MNNLVAIGLIGCAFVSGIFMSPVLSMGSVLLPLPTEKIEPGWYDWADDGDVPTPPAGFNAYVGARCLCSDGFTGRFSTDRKTFRVAVAPQGYSDTVGKMFLAKARVCLNCAD